MDQAKIMSLRWNNTKNYYYSFNSNSSLFYSSKTWMAARFSQLLAKSCLFHRVPFIKLWNSLPLLFSHLPKEECQDTSDSKMDLHPMLLFLLLPSLQGLAIFLLCTFVVPLASTLLMLKQILKNLSLKYVATIKFSQVC